MQQNPQNKTHTKHQETNKFLQHVKKHQTRYNNIKQLTKTYRNTREQTNTYKQNDTYTKHSET